MSASTTRPRPARRPPSKMLVAGIKDRQMHLVPCDTIDQAVDIYLEASINCDFLVHEVTDPGGRRLMIALELHMLAEEKVANSVLEQIVENTIDMTTRTGLAPADMVRLPKH